MTTEIDAAVARRLVRSHRDEAAYHATLPVSQSARAWRMDADHLGFTHLACGKHFGGFVDPVQTTEHAVAHDKTCEVSRG